MKEAAQAVADVSQALSPIRKDNIEAPSTAPNEAAHSGDVTMSTSAFVVGTKTPVKKQ